MFGIDLPIFAFSHCRDGVAAVSRAGGMGVLGALAFSTDQLEIERTGLEDLAIMHYTSGTTGKPKGAVHVHQAVWGHYATGKYVLDLHEDDIYW